MGLRQPLCYELLSPVGLWALVLVTGELPLAPWPLGPFESCQETSLEDPWGTDKAWFYQNNPTHDF